MNMGQKGGSKMLYSDWIMYSRQLSWVSKPVTYRDWTLRLIETQDYPVLRPVTYRDCALKLLKTLDYPVLNLWHLKIRDQTDQSWETLKLQS